MGVLSSADPTFEKYHKHKQPDHMSSNNHSHLNSIFKPKKCLFVYFYLLKLHNL